MLRIKQFADHKQTYAALRYESLAPANQQTLQTLCEYHARFYAIEICREEKAAEIALKAANKNKAALQTQAQNAKLQNVLYLLTSQKIQAKYKALVIKKDNDKSVVIATNFLHFTTAHLKKYTQTIHANMAEYIAQGLAEIPNAEVMSKMPANLARKAFTYKVYLIDLKKKMEEEKQAVIESMLERLTLTTTAYNLYYDDILRAHCLKQRELNPQRQFEYVINHPRFHLNKNLFEYCYNYLMQFGNQVIRSLLTKLSWFNGSFKIANGKLFAVPRNISEADIPIKRGWPEFLNYGANMRYKIFRNWEMFANLGLAYKHIQDAIVRIEEKSVGALNDDMNLAAEIKKILANCDSLKSKLKNEIKQLRGKLASLSWYHGDTKRVLTQLIVGFESQIQAVMEQEIKILEILTEKINPERVLNDSKLLECQQLLQKKLGQGLQDEPQLTKIVKAQELFHKKINQAQVLLFITTLKENREILPYWQRHKGSPFKRVDKMALDLHIKRCSQAVAPEITQCFQITAAFLSGEVCLTIAELKQHLKIIFIAKGDQKQTIEQSCNDFIEMLVHRFIVNSFHHEALNNNDPFLKFIKDYDQTYTKLVTREYTQSLTVDTNLAFDVLQSLLSKPPQVEEPLNEGESLYLMELRKRPMKLSRSHILAHIHTLVLASHQQTNKLSKEIFILIHEYIEKIYDGSHSYFACIFFAYGNLDVLTIYAKKRWRYLLQKNEFTQLCNELAMSEVPEQRRCLLVVMGELLNQFIMTAPESELLRLYSTLVEKNLLSVPLKNAIEHSLDLLRMNNLLLKMHAKSTPQELQVFVINLKKTYITFPATKQSIGTQLIGHEISQNRCDITPWGEQMEWFITTYGTDEDLYCYHYKWLIRMLHDNAFSLRNSHDLVAYPSPNIETGLPAVHEVLNFYGIASKNMTIVIAALMEYLQTQMHMPLASSVQSHNLIRDLLQDDFALFLEPDIVKQLGELRQQYQIFLKLRRQQHEFQQIFNQIMEQLNLGRFDKANVMMKSLYVKYQIMPQTDEDKLVLAQLLISLVANIKSIIQNKIQQAFLEPKSGTITLALMNISQELVLLLPDDISISSKHDYELWLLSFICTNRTSLISFDANHIQFVVNELLRTGNGSLLKTLCNPIIIALLLINAFGDTTKILVKTIQENVLTHPLMQNHLEHRRVLQKVTDMMGKQCIINENHYNQIHQYFKKYFADAKDSTALVLPMSPIVVGVPNSRNLIPSLPDTAFGVMPQDAQEHSQLSLINNSQRLFNIITNKISKRGLTNTELSSFRMAHEGVVALRQCDMKIKTKHILQDYLQKIEGFYLQCQQPQKNKDEKIITIQERNEKIFAQFYQQYFMHAQNCNANDSSMLNAY